MEKLITYLNAEKGRRVRLARDLGITPGAISNWRRVPGDRALRISRLTGIPVEDLLSGSEDEVDT